MKTVLIIFLIGVFANSLYAQDRGESSGWIDVPKIKEHNVKKYEIRIFEYGDQKTYFHNRIIESGEFENGNRVFGYSYNWDMVNNTDSIFYEYDSKDVLYKIVEISNDAPEGKEQEEFISDFGGRGRVISTIIKSYDDESRLAREEYYESENDTKPIVYEYSYSSDGALSRMNCYFDLYPEVNNAQEYYEYDSEEQLIKTLRVSNSLRDTTITLNEYGSNKLLLQEQVLSNDANVVTEYSYSTKNQLATKSILSKQNGRETRLKISYKYNTLGELEESKTEENTLIKEWKSFKYDDQGLKIEEINLDLQTGKPKSSVRIKYFI